MIPRLWPPGGKAATYQMHRTRCDVLLGAEENFVEKIAVRAIVMLDRLVSGNGVRGR